MKTLTITCLAILLSSCAMIIDGTDQTIRVTTEPSGATCKLMRSGQQIASLVTPDTVTIEKTKAEIKIVCNKSGYKTATYFNKSGTDPWAFGNAALLAPALAVADSASGADNKYESPVNITLQK